MTKSELIENLADRWGHFSIQDIELAVNTLIELMVDSLTVGHRVEIRGFGAFSIRARRSYWGRNPKTNERVWVPERHTLHFKPGKSMRERVNNTLPSTA